MNQDPNQQSRPANSVPEWFNPASPTPPPSKQKKSPRLLIIVVGTILVLGIAIFVAVFALQQPSTCFDATDYKSLTGVDSSSELSPTETFYAEYVLFNDATTAYDNLTDGGQHGDQLIQKIASFYKTHTNKPMTITVGASYFVPDAELLANQRIESLQSSLLKEGIPSGVVVVAGATYITPEDAVEGDSSTGEVTISITSDPTCR